MIEETKDVQISVKLHDKDALFMREDCGHADHPDLGRFELSTMFGNGLPIVRLPDGRWALFDWTALIKAACRAGGLIK